MTCYRQSKHIVTRNIAGETWLVAISGELANHEQIYSLNEVGTFIWQLLDGQTSKPEILEKLIERFEVDKNQASNDLTDQINEFEQIGLIEAVV